MTTKKKTTKKMPPWIGSKDDEKQDKKLEKGMTPAQKKKFEAADKKMDAKKPSEKADKRMDKALATKVKKTCTCGKCAACKARKAKGK
jgi:hypothetical protein